MLWKSKETCKQKQDLTASNFHCAQNHLPHSFSGGINHRTDEYGGSFENRSRSPTECIRAIRENMPEDMPLFMRIDAHDDYLENGLTIEEVIEFCKLGQKKQVLIHLTYPEEIFFRQVSNMRYLRLIFQEHLTLIMLQRSVKKQEC